MAFHTFIHNHRKCQKAHSGIVSGRQGLGQARTLARRSHKKSTVFTVLFAQGMRESNSHQRFWRPLSYHLTNPLYRDSFLTSHLYSILCESMFVNIFLHYFKFSSRDLPIVPSGISTPKLSATVAPTTANVSSSGSSPLPVMEGEYARKGTFSRVWSVPL